MQHVRVWLTCFVTSSGNFSQPGNKYLKSANFFLKGFTIFGRSGGYLKEGLIKRLLLKAFYFIF